MTTPVKLVLPLTLAAALVSSSAGAQTQPTLQGWSKDGVVWNDASSWPTLEDLARASAPVLWFSPDEFLLREGLPAPGEIGSTSRRAVYYRAARIRTSGKVHPEWKACLSRPACRLAGGERVLAERTQLAIHTVGGAWSEPASITRAHDALRLIARGHGDNAAPRVSG